MSNASQFRAVVLCGLFALSGFCGLIYESVWAHYLKLFLGHAAYAQTVVLVTFIGGMALGAAICGRLADRITQPLMIYAAVELLAGLGGALFHSVFVATTNWAYSTLLPVACSGDDICVAS
jgi:predicted membrane-bound spermidine synthase